jgi:hypothetical protein
MRHALLPILVLLAAAPTRASAAPAPAATAANPPIYVAFLWHMHQPIYWPYENVLTTQANNRYSYSVVDIFDQRTGPYTSWPSDAVWKGINAGMPHFGAQVSFSGSLIENLDNLESGGDGNFSGWKGAWNGIKNQTTSLGNPRLDLVGFGYHHPLMGLIETGDIEKQIEAHRGRITSEISAAPSHGIFPPENAFTPRMIPALRAEGLNWVLVDNIHFDRAASGYPFNASGNVYEPNRADQRNANPGDWVSLQNVWAPTPISGGWGHRPHFVQYRDPASGQLFKMVAVPADRYMGNEDGRGGFGALQYDQVMSQIAAYNTDPAHPLLVVLAHDGDNYGGGSDSYYHSNFQSFVDWLSANPSRFQCTTVEDYLQTFPPDSADVIHVENGSWSGADNGDPEFKKWLGDPGSNGYSPDDNSWAVVTAAKNWVQTAEQVNPGAPATASAWHYMLNAEASDYWYWDGSQNGIWDSHPTRAVNQALPFAQGVVSGGTDLTPPTIFVPQREPYNPGGTEWGIQQPSDFTVWSYVYDLSGLASVSVQYRLDDDGVLPVDAAVNDTYAGGAGVGAWTGVACTASDMASTTDPQPLYRAQKYSAAITGLSNRLVDYYVEAVDAHGNVGRSPIQHVWVGPASTGGGSGVSWAPPSPAIGDSIRITVAGTTAPAHLHWGVDGWALPSAAYRPAGSTLYGGSGPAVETAMNAVGGALTLTLGPFNDASQAVNKLDFVIHYDSGTWDNNSGADYHVTITGATLPRTYVLDGTLDSGITKVASNAGIDLYLDWNGTDLYVATQAASGVGQDVFAFVAASRGALVAPPWAKSGRAGQWSAFLGNESTNNWCGWTGASGAAHQAAGAVLEGTLNLAGQMGAIPAVVYVAIGRYATADGGALTAQCPAGDGDPNLDGAEYLAFAIGGAGVAPLGAASAAHLLPPSPSPARGRVTLAYVLPREGEVALEVFDVRGRRVAIPEGGRRVAGEHAVTWDASGAPAGVYFARLRAGGASETRRVLVIR